MISLENDIAQFLDAVEDRSIGEILYMADREATEAERVLLKSGKREPATLTYCTQLKELVNCLRYSVRPPCFDDSVTVRINRIRNRDVQECYERVKVGKYC